MDDVQRFLYELCKKRLEDIHFIDDKGNADPDKWDEFMYVKEIVELMEKQMNIQN